VVARLLLVVGLLLAAGRAAAAPLLGDGDPLLGGGSNRMIFNAPLTRPGLLPGDLTCMDGTPAVPALRCFVPPGEDRWACVGSDGVEIPVVQGVGTTYEDGPWGRAARVDSAARAPRIEAPASAAFRALWAGDSTVIVVGRPGDSTTTRYWFSHGGFSTGGVYMRQTADNNVVWTDGTSETSAAVGLDVRATWAIASGRRIGATITARVNGTAGPAKTIKTGVDTTPPEDASIKFGSSSSGITTLGGPLSHALIYGCALTDDSLARLESQIYGTRASDGRLAATPYTGGKWCDGGWQVGDNAPCLDASGMESRRAVLELIPNNTSLGDSGWVAVGDGVTVNADKTLTLTDDAAGFYEGVRWTIPGATNGDPGAIECEVRSTTGARVRIAVGDNLTTDGQSYLLTPEWQAVSITRASVSGVPRPGVFVGPWAADIGAIDVRRCQFVKAPYIGRRCDAGASPTTCPGDVASVPVADIPPGAEVCATIEPFACTGDGQVVLDTRDADGDGIVLYLDDECHLALDATWPMPMTVSDAEPVPIGEPTEVCWRLSPGFQVRRDGQPSVTLSTAILGHGDTLWIGVDRDGEHQLEGRIKDVEVRR
jgi:hypothetical protein